MSSIPQITDNRNIVFDFAIKFMKGFLWQATFQT